MQRITRKQLDSLVQLINEITGAPLKPYERQGDGTLRANVGNFHLSMAYGGYCIHRMQNDEGGVSTPIWSGHIPARDAYECGWAFVRGLQFKS